MRGEGLGDDFFVSQHFGRLIDMLLAAFITPNHQGPGQGRPRGEGVGLTEGYSMPIKSIFLMMVAMVFADYHPTVSACVPHGASTKTSLSLVAGDQRCE
jgi:hypothetical protein